MKLDGHPEDLTLNPRIAGSLVVDTGWRLGGGRVLLKQTISLSAHMPAASSATLNWNFFLIPSAFQPFILLDAYLYITPITINTGNLAFSLGTNSSPADDMLVAFSLTTGQRATRGYKQTHLGTLLLKSSLDSGGDTFSHRSSAPSIGGDSGGDNAGTTITMSVVRSGTLTVSAGDVTCLVALLPILPLTPV